MAAYCYERGHKHYFDNKLNKWVNEQTKEIYNENAPIKCVRCRRVCDGYDACLGKLGKVVAACCGHGKEYGYIKFDNGVTITGDFYVTKEPLKIENII